METVLMRDGLVMDGMTVGTAVMRGTVVSILVKTPRTYWTYILLVII